MVTFFICKKSGHNLHPDSAWYDQRDSNACVRSTEPKKRRLHAIFSLYFGRKAFLRAAIHFFNNSAADSTPADTASLFTVFPSAWNRLIFSRKLDVRTCLRSTDHLGVRQFNKLLWRIAGRTLEQLNKIRYTLIAAG